MNIDGLAQDYGDSSALAMKLSRSFTATMPLNVIATYVHWNENVI